MNKKTQRTESACEMLRNTTPSFFLRRRGGFAQLCSFTSNSPNPHLSLLADKCTSMSQLQQIHAQMIITRRIHDNFASSRLISFSALSDSGDLNYALKLFNSIQNPNSFMYNTLIRAQATPCNPQASIFLYINMNRVGVVPGKHTFPFLLKACSILKSLESSNQVHCQAFKYGLDLDLHVVNALVRCYSVTDNLNDARQVFDGSSEKNLSIWSTMICGYAQAHVAQEALKLFDEMIACQIEPSSITLSSVLSACAQSGCLDLGQKIHHYMHQKGIEVGVILGTALVHMYAKNGAIELAENCFHCMPEKNIATWNAMICGLAAHGYAKEAINLFTKLEKQHNINPNGITFVGVLSACCHAGLLDYGHEIFGHMKSVYGVEPKIEHYGCMVDLLSRCGKLIEAEQLIKNMPCKADVIIWGALLKACKNIEIAERVVKQMLVLDPHNHGVYVRLSNLYAEVGRWDDVSRLRIVMKQESLRKTPGWSLVDGEQLNID